MLQIQSEVIYCCQNKQPGGCLNEAAASLGMKLALAVTNIAANEVDYVDAHPTAPRPLI